MSHVPKLRFKEFSGEWEEKTLGEVSCKVLYGIGSAAIAYDGVNKYLRITDIDESSRTFIPNPLTSPEGEIEEKYKLVKNDIVFARTGASTGKSYLYNEKDGNLIYAGFLIKFHINKANSYFVYANTFKEYYNKWVKVMSVRSGQPGINAEEYKTLPLLLPSKPEQEKIASFLTSVDTKIELLVRKEELLQQYKKGVMQKIFSQERRFKADDGSEYPDWEEKKVIDIFDVTRGYVLAVTKMSEFMSGAYKYPVYSSQTKNKGLTGYFTEYLYEDCITWTTDGANAGDVNFRQGKFYCTNVCGVLKSDEGYANECIAQILNSITKKYVSYVGNPKLMNNVMGNIVIKIPLSIQEQTKIASFLSSIDTKIEHIQKQLNATKAFKKALLQQMFV